MKFRQVSDLHLDFSQVLLPECEDDFKTTLLIAGDMCEGRHLYILENFLDAHARRFHNVIMVLGNHDFYGTNMYTHMEKFRKEIVDQFPNVHVLDNSSMLCSDDVVVIGSVLWTDFDKQSPTLMHSIKNCMADYMWISKDEYVQPNERITPQDILEEHIRSVKYLNAAIKYHKAHGRKVVVLTHHAPTWQSVGDGFEGDPMNGGFVSDLSGLILDTEPDIWSHGHVHSFKDYVVGKTRILCNPRGYHTPRGTRGEITNWNPEFSFEL